MKPREKEQAVTLRKQGWSYAEICKKLSISKSTAWHWQLAKIPLSADARFRLLSRSINGNRHGILTRQNIIKKREKIITKLIQSKITRLQCGRKFAKIFCALIYWCEGSKNRFTIKFTNSDPTLVKTFITFLRKGFALDEKKLRILMHLHEYHDEQKQKLFWSKISKIPFDQFSKTYRKPHTGKVKRDNYPGCVTIAYGDRWLIFEMRTIWEELAKRHGGVVQQ